MSAELISRPRPVINYGRDKINPPKGFSLGQLEAHAWWFWDRRARIEDCSGDGRAFAINRPVRKILQLIIEQYGWPERG